MPRPITIRTYEIIAFVTGFALMSYELVASRLLSPTIGSSTYVWTSIIGVIIAALSLGYAVGGWLADKRIAKGDIAWLLLASSFAMASTLLLSDAVLASTSRIIADTRLQGIVVSLILFMPTSFLLGTISPYLVRLHTASITTAGRSVAALSALNSLGGICGTFLAGFVFFGHMGSRETLGVVIAIVLLCSWLILPKQQLLLRSGIVAVVALLTLIGILPNASAGTIAAIDTASSHYTVARKLYDGKTIRALSMGPSGYQSGVYEDDPHTLAFAYTQRMADIAAEAPHKARILILGGGAFTLPQHLAVRYPDTTIDVVEIDPELEHIARQYFSYTAPANVRVINQDARAYLNQTSEQYDIIMIDVYSDISVPFTLTTAEYGKVLKTRLAPQGVVIANLIGAKTPACSPILGSIHAAYSNAFMHYLAFPLQDRDLQSTQNIIAVYSNNSLTWISGQNWPTTALPHHKLYDDNFAPTDKLQTKCWS